MFEGALELLALVEASTPDELQAAHVELLRGQIAFASSMGSRCTAVALEGCPDALSGSTPSLRARPTSTRGELRCSPVASPPPAAWSRYPVLPNRLRGRPARSVHPICCSMASPPSSRKDVRRPRHCSGGQRPCLRTEASPGQENFRWGWLTTNPPNLVWDEDSWHAISARNLKEARDAGALARLPIDLADWGIFVAWCGDFGAAAVAIAEAEAITKATGTHIAPYAQLLLSALRGQSDALPLIESTIRDAETGGQGLSVQWAEWTSAILFNGLGRYDQALASAQRAAEETPQLQHSPWASTELIEAAVRTGEPDVAAGCARARDGGHRALQHRLGPGNASALPGTLERG